MPLFQRFQDVMPNHVVLPIIGISEWGFDDLPTFPTSHGAQTTRGFVSMYIPMKITMLLMLNPKIF